MSFPYNNGGRKTNEKERNFIFMHLKQQCMVGTYTFTLLLEEIRAHVGSHIVHIFFISRLVGY